MVSNGRIIPRYDPRSLPSITRHSDSSLESYHTVFFSSSTRKRISWKISRDQWFTTPPSTRYRTLRKPQLGPCTICALRPATRHEQENTGKQINRNTLHVS
ncbi:hypothetical protein BDR07DRAFT_1414447 [Suillus spraguei]|nr:hypothetical protein BDR07DRAFT_1414447 [Suillus spraguei]